MSWTEYTQHQAERARSGMRPPGGDDRRSFLDNMRQTLTSIENASRLADVRTLAALARRYVDRHGNSVRAAIIEREEQIERLQRLFDEALPKALAYDREHPANGLNAPEGAGRDEMHLRAQQIAASYFGPAGSGDKAHLAAIMAVDIYESLVKGSA